MRITQRTTTKREGEHDNDTRYVTFSHSSHRRTLIHNIVVVHFETKLEETNLHQRQSHDLEIP